MAGSVSWGPVAFCFYFAKSKVSVYVQLLLLSSGRDCMRFCGLSLASGLLTATASPGKHKSGK